MKVNSLQRDMSLKQGSLTLHSEPKNFREKNSAGVYKNNDNRGYNAAYSGSFTGKSEAAATALKKGGILTKNWFSSFLSYCYNHNISTSALIALGLAGVLRPATIMALPGKKDKEDKIYASGHSMASGIIGFVASTIITSPFDESIKKVFGDPEKYKSKKLTKMLRIEKALEQRASLKNAAGEIINTKSKQLLKNIGKHKGAMETLVKNVPDWIIAVPRATLTIALIPPILKYVFGVEKKKKPENTEQKNMNAVNTLTANTNNTDNSNVETPKMDFIEKPAFQQFKGGVK